jgi:hypothetical protein
VPYTRKQCRLFGAKSSRGESVPDDWQDYCRKGSGKGSKAKPKAGKPKARRRPSG